MIRNFIPNLSGWRKAIVFSGLLSLAHVLSAQSQSCNVTQQNITILPATCEGNGRITIDNTNLTGATYTLSGGGIAQSEPQTNNVFESLSPGTYTLSVACEGAVTPTIISNLVVASSHSTLEMALTGNLTCATNGTITATAYNGYNQGNNAQYRYAIWKSTTANAGRPDSEVDYSTAQQGPMTFTGKDAGTYFVRVKDQCENFITRSIILTESQPAYGLTVRANWVCQQGNTSLSVQGSLGNFAAGAIPAGYTYKVEAIHPGAISEPCSVKQVVSTIVSEKPITDAASMLFSVPQGVTNYRITTTSPCGQTIQSCHTVGTPINLTLRKTYGSCNDLSLSRLTHQISASSGFTISYPATLTLTGTNYSNSKQITGGLALNGALDNIPTSAYPITATFTDACGTVQTSTINGFDSGFATEAPSPGYNFDCVDVGRLNLDFQFSGGYIDVTAPGVKFELLDGTEVVAVGRVNNATTNSIRMMNVPTGKAFTLQITAPGSETCTFTYPVSAVGVDRGMRLNVNPEILTVCDQNFGTFSWKTDVTLQSYNRVIYTIFQETPSGKTVYRTDEVSSGVPASNNIALAPGSYSWQVEYKYITDRDSCNQTVTGNVFEIQAQGVAPKINKIFGATCESIDEVPLTTGFVSLDYSGNGPFTIEQSLVGTTDYTVVGTNVADLNYTVENLVAGNTYFFRITDRCGNSVSQQVTIKPISPRIMQLTEFQPCKDQPYSIDGIDYPNATYSWKRLSDGVVVSTNKTLSFESFTTADAGEYELTLRISDCITRISTINLVANESCNVPFSLGSIGQIVWIDTNRDGIHNNGEVGIENVTVTLEAFVGPQNPTSEQLANGGYWSVYETIQTDVDGKYLFNNLASGYYRVKFDAPSGYMFTTYQAAGTDPENTSLVKDSNAGSGGYSTPVYINTEGIELAIHNTTIDAGLVATGSVGTRVWADDNNNGIYDGQESGIANVEVTLYKQEEGSENWVEVGKMMTSSAGEYKFDNLVDGTYRVHFGNVEGKEHTLYKAGNNTTTDSDADRTTGYSDTFTINTSLPITDNGRNRTDVDAGYIVQGALPVHLVSFTITPAESSVSLNWATSYEDNSAKFVVLQSVNGSDWNAIGEVKAKGNSMDTHEYVFTDGQPSNGINYYRLQMVDLDGTYSFSNIRSAKLAISAVKVNLYPNPATDFVRIESNGRNAATKVEVFDVNGRSVLVDTQMYEGKQISVKGLIAGNYILKVTLSNGATEIRHLSIGK